MEMAVGSASRVLDHKIPCFSVGFSVNPYRKCCIPVKKEG
jgi:hypothetical protein